MARMEMSSLTQANLVVETVPDPASAPSTSRWGRSRASRTATTRPRVTLSVFHNMHFTYEASEVSRTLDDSNWLGHGVGPPGAAGWQRWADEVLFAAGWGTVRWGAVSTRAWQVAAFDLADPDLCPFLQRALQGGRLLVTRHTDKIGRYLRHAGGDDLARRFVRDVAGEYPAMAQGLTREWGL